MPKDLAARRFIGHQIPAHIARKNELSRSSENAISTAIPAHARITMTPCDLARLVVDGGEIAAHGSHHLLILAAQTHRAARIGLSEVVHGVRVALRNVKQA